MPRFNPPILTFPPRGKGPEGGLIRGFLKERGTIPVHPVARLALSPERLLELIRALQTNYRNYQETQARRQADAGATE